MGLPCSGGELNLSAIQFTPIHGGFCKILADRQPYHDIKRDQAVILALSQGKPPADIKTLQVPHPVKALLKRCWSTNPTTRPTLARCESLLLQTLRLVESRGPDVATGTMEAEGWAIASRFDAKSEEWYAYRNPEDEKAIRVDALSDSFRDVYAL